MNVYDFDQTIYRGDSTVDFYFYCLRHYPLMVRSMPGTAAAFGLYRARAWSKTQFKQVMYRFLLSVPQAEQVVERFWASHIKNIKLWYIQETRRTDDVVISASPEFLLRPVCRQLEIPTLIASRVDAKTGKYTGINCWGEEKVRRFREVFGDAEIDTFYSDSLSDTPLARLAKEAWIVRGNQWIPWAVWEAKKRGRT